MKNHTKRSPDMVLVEEFHVDLFAADEETAAAIVKLGPELRDLLDVTVRDFVYRRNVREVVVRVEV